MGAGWLSRNERVDDVPSRGRRRRDRLYPWVALLAALIIFAGFGRTFYLRSVSGAPALSALLVVHGLVMTSWFVVFGLQVWLVASGRTGVHRRVGLLGLVVAVLVVIVGVAAAIDAGRRGASPAPDVSPLMFMAVPLFDMPVFGLLVGVALWHRRRPDVHKRLMLLATLGMLTPAIARIPLGFIQQGGPPVFFGLALLLVLACIAADTARSGRLHPAFAWGGALIVAMLPLRLLIATSDAWTRFAGWLIS
jgi:hypothetical protein